VIDLTPPTPRVARLGEHVWLVELGATVDTDVNRRVVALAAWIRGQAWPEVRDVVPAFASLAVHVGPVADPADVERRLRAGLATPQEPDALREGRIVEIPVRYGGAHGPDLDEVAALTRLAPREIVERHAGRTYDVFMLGFLPGFAYLGIVDPAIQVPRRSSPRTRVPAGSVGLAGAQTGVYPRESPGGWQIIGRTDVSMFDASLSAPSRLTPGDRVRFVPVEGAP
jgi:KipI family sensor histidine kinase inhibitor